MVELKMDNDRIVDIDKDPITEEFVFEFKEKIKKHDQPESYETKAVQRIPIRVVANWSKVMYHQLDLKIYDDEEG